MSKVYKERAIKSRFQRIQALRIQALLEGAQSNGVSGVVETVYRMISPDQPAGAAECLRKADADFASASNGEQVWGAALKMAECLRHGELEVVVEPEDHPDPNRVPSSPNPVLLEPASAGNLVLAALLTRLHGQPQTKQPKGAVVETAPTGEPSKTLV